MAGLLNPFTVVEQPDIQLSQVAEILMRRKTTANTQNQEFKQAPPEIRQDRVNQLLASMNSHYKRQIIHDN